MAKQIPTRIYRRRKEGPYSGGTIWGGALSPGRGFPTSFLTSAVTPIEIVEEAQPVSLTEIGPIPSVEDTPIPIVDMVPTPTPVAELPVTEVNDIVEPAVVAGPAEEAQVPTPPKLIPASPVPFQPDHIHGFQTELNADGTRTILIKNSRITIPDSDILAVIPDR
ncbi:hypothetical protein [Terribacillus saccharophilus]|uniref:hypothetical protein n=1 Tax=Terribacillus saccharophilus TaxID=361277 RepID=UPI000BA760FF|nr:hypothetical protein [Terribacillus saccharophilus]PAF19064.1 hypothetical protein CHH51_05045 [Terribacillus saccharophilus]